MNRQVITLFALTLLCGMCFTACEKEPDTQPFNAEDFNYEEAQEGCPEEWLSLYDVEALMDEAVTIEEAASSMGVDTTIIDTSSEMPTACEPIKNAYDALTIENASAQKQLEAAQIASSSVYRVRVDYMLMQVFGSGAPIIVPAGCLGAQDKMHYVQDCKPSGVFENDPFWIRPERCEPSYWEGKNDTEPRCIHWTIGSIE